MLQPNPTNLIEQIGLTFPIIGFYDAPDISPFKPLVRPKSGIRACVFAFYNQWLQGITLHITEDNTGCGGACHWLFNMKQGHEKTSLSS